MLSGGKPDAAMVSRYGPLRLFQVGTPRPSLSLPSPVSTTMRCFGVSTTSEWIDIFSRPSSVAKCGISQGSFLISSRLASGKMKRVEPTVSSSTTLVILTLPILHCCMIVLAFVILPVVRPCWFRPCRAIGSTAGLWRYRGQPGENATMPELTISPEKVAFLIEKAREFDVKDVDADPGSGSSPADDDNID